MARRSIMTAVKRARKSYKLSTGDVFVLDTLLSFMPCRDKVTGVDRPVSPDMVLIVYASNETICSRANGMDERVLRRHLSKLLKAGLIGRKDSATGKRFPLRSNGRVRDAFGIDLNPLLRTYPEVAAEAERLEVEAGEIRALRAQALALRAELLKNPNGLNDESLSFIEKVKTILRRSTLSLSKVAGLIRDMAALTRGQRIKDRQQPVSAPCPAPEVDQEGGITSMTSPEVQTDKESGGNGLNVRQVESIKIDPYKEGDTEYARLLKAWAACPNISSLCPDAITSPSRLREAVFIFGSFLTLKKEALADGVARIGWVNMLTALEYLAENANRIKSPRAYFQSMIDGFVAGNPVAGMR